MCLSVRLSVDLYVCFDGFVALHNSALVAHREAALCRAKTEAQRCLSLNEIPPVLSIQLKVYIRILSFFFFFYVTSDLLIFVCDLTSDSLILGGN